MKACPATVLGCTRITQIRLHYGQASALEIQHCGNGLVLAANSLQGTKLTCLPLPAGKWLPAPILPHTVLINLGLMMEAWTSGLCVATLHRVVFPPSPSPKPRRSIAYFGTPDPEVLLMPVRNVEAVEAKPALKVKEFFNERLKRAEVPKEARKDFSGDLNH
jgi:isopenicillin N synthase-like dioxygenase